MMRPVPLLLAFLPAVALAQASTAPATKPAAGKASDDDKMICVSQAATGSLIASKRECKTRRQWREETEASQRQLRDCSTNSHC